MSSPEDVLVIKDLGKTYKLYPNRWDMAWDIGLSTLGFKSKKKFEQFEALKNINLTIKKGERIGLIGRNGAGKSTLLKLMTGNFAQTSGSIVIHGKVQALMNIGHGFHPEISGLENIKASLIYNGLNKEQFETAVDDVIDFVELGEFINQPLKTYSLGMRSRLFFAVATAIQPEILIVDEVLAAGDAYFNAKSADRMLKLTRSGCTLILVSHSTQQIIQFCDQAIWLECGEIVLRGEAIEVVKAYEAYAKNLELESTPDAYSSNVKGQSLLQSKWFRAKLLSKVLDPNQLGKDPENTQTKVSRWPSQEDGLKVSAMKILNKDKKQTNYFRTGDAIDIEIIIKAERADRFDVYFMILLFTEDGRYLSRHCSDKFELNLGWEEEYCIRLKIAELLLGNGKYLFSAGIYKILDLHHLATARYYDMLTRSFEFEVKGHYAHDESIMTHPARWEPVCNQEPLSLVEEAR